MFRTELLEQYKIACEYPGKLDQSKVEDSLKKYLSCLGVKRDVVRLNRNWDVFSYSDILANVKFVLNKYCASRASRDALAALAARDARASRDARDARASRDASDARAALAALAARASRDALAALASRDARDARAEKGKINMLSRFCVTNYWGYSHEASWVSLTWIGANENNKEYELKWSSHIFDAFLNGCWFLYWTETTLYWFAKPTVKTITQNNRKLLHSENGAALISDWKDMYFLNGVMVNESIVMTPAEQIDPHILLKEKNAEVRREIVRKIGIERVCLKLGAKSLDKSSNGVYELLNLDLGDGRSRPYLKMRNPSIQTWHLEGVPTEIKTVQQALNWRNQTEENPLILT